ncbi:hypothetical protein KBF38_00400 [bacterium]|nr:hypothetical protein [bacterium]
MLKVNRLLKLKTSHRLSATSSTAAFAPIVATLLFTGLSMLIATPCQASKPLTKTVDKFEFKVEFNGTSTLLIADDGAIWRVPSTGITYYCMAPSWKIIVFNNATNRGRIFPYEHWHNREEGKDPIRIKSRLVVPAFFQGKAATLLRAEIEPMESLKNQGEFFYRSSSRKTNEYSRIEVLELKDKKLTKQALEFVRWRFSMPFLSGPLLKFTNIYPNGKRETIASVTSMLHTTIPISEWRAPKNFKEVDSTSKVNDEKASYKKAAEMFDSLMP